MLGRVLRNVLNRLGAMAPVSRAAARRPAAIERAIELVNAGELTAARELLQGILATHSDDAEALHQLARVALRQDRIEEAIVLLERAVSAAPKSATALVTYGNLRRARGELDLAARLYSRAIDVREDCIE